MLEKVEQSYVVYNKISGALLYLTPLQFFPPASIFNPLRSFFWCL